MILDLSFAHVTIITGIAAVLCLPAIAFWGLGIPGNPESGSGYATGWNIGMRVLILYPLFWLIVYVPYFVLRLFIPELGGPEWESRVAQFMVVASMLAVGGMLLAVWEIGTG